MIYIVFGTTKSSRGIRLESIAARCVHRRSSRTATNARLFSFECSSWYARAWIWGTYLLAFDGWTVDDLQAKCGPSREDLSHSNDADLDSYRSSEPLFNQSRKTIGFSCHKVCRCNQFRWKVMLNLFECIQTSAPACTKERVEERSLHRQISYFARYSNPLGLCYLPGEFAWRNIQQKASSAHQCRFAIEGIEIHAICGIIFWALYLSFICNLSGG